MDWLTKLKDIKSASGLTTKDIAKLSNIPEPTLEKIFAGQTKDPKLQTMTQLVHSLGHTLDDLLVETECDSERLAVDASEQSLLTKYRALDAHGKEIVEANIKIEYARCKTLQTEASEKGNASLKKSSL